MHTQRASIAETPASPRSGRKSEALALWSMPWPTVVSRTVPLSGRRARLRLESLVWSSLDEIARKQHRPVHELCKDIDARRPPGTPLTSAIRGYVLDHFRKAEAK